MRILIAEDDGPLADLLIRCLREESYAVDHAADGQEAEWMAFENPYDLIILDLMLPRKDGIAVLRDLRSGGMTSPVMILTARDAKDDLVQGLDTGADDYLTKPFSLDELMARIRALFRRKQSTSPAPLEAGPIHINPARKEVRIDHERLDLTSKEYALFEYFVRNAGSVLSRTELSEHVWDINFEPSSNVVDVYVGYLRNKISKVTGGLPLIRTVRGHGYMLDTELLPLIKEGAQSPGKGQTPDAP
ncbi:MAG: response regulator transcription factor [Deltaproteobacteria bacterium]|nr:response regulator transcription factor [Deltaproteobacteria bacterium]